MSEITRFCNWCAATHSHDMMEHEHGAWVRYADHLAALAAKDEEIAKEREAHQKTHQMLVDEVQDNVSLCDRHVTQAAADEIKRLEHWLAELEPVLEAVRETKRRHGTHSCDSIPSDRPWFCPICSAARKAGV